MVKTLEDESYDCFQKENFIALFKGTKWEAETETVLWEMFEKSRTSLSVDVAMDLLHHCYPAITFDAWFSSDRSHQAERVHINNAALFTRGGATANFERPAHLLLLLFIRTTLIFRKNNPGILTGKIPWEPVKGPPFTHGSVMSSAQG